MYFKVALLLLLVQSLGPIRADLSADEVTQVLNNALRGYDKRIRPNHGGKAVEVEVTFYALKMFEFSSLNNDFKLDFFLRHRWSDPRLAFPQKGEQKIDAPYEVIQKIWVPDTFFPSDKDGYRAAITVPNAFIRINSNGTVFTSQRFTTHTNCEGGLQFFPLDRHRCKLDIESYGYDNKSIIYKWRNYGSSGVGVRLPSFDLVGLQEYRADITLSTGTYSRIGVEFIIDRQTLGYIWRYYCPAVLIVITSWLPFGMRETNSSLPRAVVSAVALFAFLVFMTITNAVFTPDTGTTTCLDIYLLICLFFVFGALFLVIYTLNLMDIIKDKKAGLNADSGKSIATGPEERKLTTVDRMGRLLLPFLFLLFNVAYWLPQNL